MAAPYHRNGVRGSLYFENQTPLPWRAEGLYDREPSPEGKVAEAPPEAG